MNHLIEIRSLNLKPGTRDEFHHLYVEEALPLLKRWNFDVVAGPSLHDENPYQNRRLVYASLLFSRYLSLPLPLFGSDNV